MNRLIFPDIFKGRVTAFFTGKDPGDDLAEISKSFSTKQEDIDLPIQKHTDKIVLLESSREPVIADAVITKEEGVLIGVRVADCVPILLYEKEKRVMGAVHAGWRGTAAGIVKKTIKKVMERFGGRGEDFLVAIGPSIKGSCYAVDHAVADAVRMATGEGEYCIIKGEKYYLDLPSANKQQVLSLGVPEQNIWVSSECTFCNPEKFFSYRFSKGSAGRQAGFIGKT